MGSPSGDPPARPPPENTTNNKQNQDDSPKDSDNPTYAHTLKNAQNTTLTNSKKEQNNISVRRTTHNGIQAVIFKAKDYYGCMANNCKKTIVGRFIKTRPQIEKIRSKFNELFPLKGSVKIGVYDNFNVFIDFTNSDDFNLVWFKRVVEINGLPMWLQKWSPDFKPEEDMPIAPVWVLLPGLPYHLYDWDHVKLIVSEIGTPLASDLATSRRSRPNMAKVRVEVDLLKPLPTSLWVGMEDDNTPLKGFEQKIEYEGVPRYCKHCKKMGHVIAECRIVGRKVVVEQKQAEEKVAESQHNHKVFDIIPEPHGEGTSKQDEFIEIKKKKRKNELALKEQEVKEQQEQSQQDSVRSSKDEDNLHNMEHPTVTLVEARGKNRKKNNSENNETEVENKEKTEVVEVGNAQETIVKRTRKKKKKKGNIAKKKLNVTFKPNSFTRLLRGQSKGSTKASSSKNSNEDLMGIVAGNNLMTGSQEGKNNSSESSSERGVSDTIVQEVDQPIKGQGKQINHSTKKNVDNRQTSTSRSQECPTPDLQSETISAPVERMRNTQDLYLKRLNRMVEGWKKERREELAKKENEKNSISKSL